MEYFEMVTISKCTYFKNIILKALYQRNLNVTTSSNHCNKMNQISQDSPVIYFVSNSSCSATVSSSWLTLEEIEIVVL